MIGSAAQAEMNFDVYTFDWDGGVCNPDYVEGADLEFIANIGTEGFVYVAQTRRWDISGELVDMKKTSNGLVQLLIDADAIYDQYGESDGWFTLDPKGYFAEGKLSDPAAVRAGHTLSQRMVPCDAQCDADGEC